MPDDPEKKTVRRDAMQNYQSAFADHQVADFDVTQIDKLGIIVGKQVVDFAYLQSIPEQDRLLLLRTIGTSYAVNFGFPHGVNWGTNPADLPPIVDEDTGF